MATNFQSSKFISLFLEISFFQSSNTLFFYRFIFQIPKNLKLEEEKKNMKIKKKSLFFSEASISINWVDKKGI